jgi:malate dehydrogenase (oxaloacetate-decarboxylating)
VTVAGLLNALRIVGKPIGDVRVTFIGSGASNTAISRLCFKAGVDPAKAIVVDSKGTLHCEREDIRLRRAEYVDKWRLCQITNMDGREGGPELAMEGADVAICLSKPGPAVLLPEWVKRMNTKAVVFACANPVPEIWPWEALEAGAAVVATGRSDFPNQVNNSLGFPGIFRGALDVRASTITNEMCYAAADALAGYIDDRIDAEHILPSMDDWEVFPREAAAVGMMAQKQGVARLSRSYDELFLHASSIIRRSRRLTKMMMDEKFIASPPED